MLARRTKTKGSGMEHLTVHLQAGFPLPIGPIPDDWAVEESKMYPDLMGPAGFWMHSQQRVRPEVLLGVVYGCRGTAPAREHRYTLAMLGIAPERRLDPPRGRRRPPVHQREILFFDAAILKLRLKILMRLIVLGHHNYARGVLVQSMNDTWSAPSSYTRDIRRMGESRMH